MSPIMFFIVVTLFMIHYVTQTLAQTVSPTIAPSTRAPGTPTQAPGTPTQAPGTPTQAPGTPTQAPGTPTQAPVTPTRAPGSPSFAPTYAPTSTGYCPAYSASYTSSATTNYAICSIEACPGDTVLMTTCSPGSYNGDTYLRLYDPSTGEQLAYNDDYDSYGEYQCSQIIYTFTASCRTYELREGCYENESCSGQVYYSGSSLSSSPSSIPTVAPSSGPAVAPSTGFTSSPTATPSFTSTEGDVSE